MSEQIIKVSPQSIEFPAYNIYVHAISILLVALLLKLVFGKQITTVIDWVKDVLKDFFNKQSHEDWLAHCRDRKDWPQKQDALALDLKGHYIKNLTFSITLKDHPGYWRAGFVMGNEKLKANEVVDTKNGITIHTGSGYEKKDKILPVWKYYNEYDRGNPDSSSVKSDNAGYRTFSISINKNNFMQVKVQNDVIFAQRIDPSLRRRVYLKAWTDSYPDAKIKFRDISYVLWS